MPVARAVSLTLTASEHLRLKKMALGHKTPRQARQRATIVLLAARGCSNARISARTRLHVTVRTWRGRFATGGLPALADRKRSGRPAWFTALQVAEVKALACQLPAGTGASLSRWSCPELAREVVGRSIAGAISPSTVRRQLKQDALKPWQYQSWIFARDPAFRPKAARVRVPYRGWLADSASIADDGSFHDPLDGPGARTRRSMGMSRFAWGAVTAGLAAAAWASATLALAHARYRRTHDRLAGNIAALAHLNQHCLLFGAAADALAATAVARRGTARSWHIPPGIGTGPSAAEMRTLALGCGGDPYGPVHTDDAGDRDLRQVREENSQQLSNMFPTGVDYPKITSFTESAEEPTPGARRQGTGEPVVSASSRSPLPRGPARRSGPADRAVGAAPGRREPPAVRAVRHGTVRPPPRDAARPPR